MTQGSYTAQTVSWVPLPKRTTPSSVAAVLSVFVAPRLEATSIFPYPVSYSLSQFPDFLDWPSVINNASFVVEFCTDPSFPPGQFKSSAATPQTAPHSDYWKLIFQATTLVEPFQFDDYKDRIVRSYPVAQVYSFLKEQYKSVAATSDLSSAQTLLGAGLNQIALHPHLAAAPQDMALTGGPVSPLSARGLMSQLNEFLKNSKPGKKAIPPITFKDPSYNFAQVEAFHRPLNAVDPLTHEPNRVALTPDYNTSRIDFHQILSLLSQYPALMRLLGLVLDFEIPPTIAPEGFVRVIPTWQPKLGATVNYLPKTCYKLTGNLFVPKPAPGSDIKDGMLNLNDASLFMVLQLDIDGAALKAMNFADNLMRLQISPTPDTPEEAGMPSLRSTGFSIVRIGRASKLSTTFLRASEKNSNLVSHETKQVTSNEIELYADDLVRGYRLDVKDSDTWYSTCERLGTYQFSGGGSISLEDEGYVQTGATTAADNAMSPSDLYLHESLFHWDGWSLSAPRPGGSIEVATSDKPTQVHSWTSAKLHKALTPTPDFNLTTAFTAKPHSLPRLRFGQEYRLRVRVVDLAGNSRDRDSISDESALPSVTYFRFEPVSAPAIVLHRPLVSDPDKVTKEQNPLSPGESLERMVIRSRDETGTPVDANILGISKDYADNYESQRHVAPPKTSQMMAELHGKFDDGGNWYSVITTLDGNFQTMFDSEQKQKGAP